METPTWGPRPGRDACSPQDSTPRVSLATKAIQSSRTRSPSMGRLARNIAKAYGSPGPSRLKQINRVAQDDFDSRSQRSNSVSTTVSNTSEHTLGPSSEFGETSQVFNVRLDGDTSECATLADTPSGRVTTLNTLPDSASSSTSAVSTGRLALPFHSHRAGLSRLERRISSHPYTSQMRRRKEAKLLRRIEEAELRRKQEEEKRRDSILDAHDLIRKELKSHDRWRCHMDQIRIICDLTEPELKAVGRLSREKGVHECRQVIRVPVIHDEIAVFLWTRLAEEVLHGPKFDRDLRAEVEAEQRRDRAKEVLEMSDKRWRHENSIEYKPSELNDSPTEPDDGRSRSFNDPFTPPMSPKDLVQRTHEYFCTLSGTVNCRCRRRPSQAPCNLCYADSIVEEECDDGPPDIHSAALDATRGRVVQRGRAGSGLLPGFRNDKPPPCVFNVSRDGSQARSLKWYHPSSSRASSQSRDPGQPRKGSLAERLGVAVGGFGSRIGGVLGESMSHGYGQQPRQYRERRNSI